MAVQMGFLEAVGIELGPEGEAAFARPWEAGIVRGKRCLKTWQFGTS